MPLGTIRPRKGRRARSGAAAVGTAALATCGFFAATPAFAAGPAVSASPSSGLTDGQSITYHATGFGTGDTLVVAQCIKGASGQKDCAAVGAGAVTTKAGSDGSASGSLTVKVGKVGSGTCDSDHPCILSVTDLSTIGSGPGGAPVTVTTSLTFNATGGKPPTTPAGGKPSTTKPSSSASGKPATSGGAEPTTSHSAPSGPSGPELAHTGPGDVPAIAAGAGAMVLAGGAALVLLRRRTMQGTD